MMIENLSAERGQVPQSATLWAVQQAADSFAEDKRCNEAILTRPVDQPDDPDGAWRKLASSGLTPTDQRDDGDSRIMEPVQPRRSVMFFRSGGLHPRLGQHLRTLSTMPASGRESLALDLVE